MGAGHVSHRRTSAFDDHLYHSFVIFENLDLLQNLNLAIYLIDNVEPHYPRDNIGVNHFCDECFPDRSCAAAPLFHS